MGRFINPFTDYGFKFLFGREVEKELLIDFLNDLLVGVGLVFNASGVKDVLLQLFNKIIGA